MNLLLPFVFTWHIKFQAAFQVFADTDPLIFSGRYLLEMYNVVTSWTVSVFIKVESVSAQSCNKQLHASLYGLLHIFQRHGHFLCNAQSILHIWSIKNVSDKCSHSSYLLKVCRKYASTLLTLIHIFM